MKRLLLPVAVTTLSVLSACSSEKGDAGAAATASRDPASEMASDAASEPAAEDAASFASEIKTIAFDSVAALPRAPASAASQSECEGFVRSPQSAGGRAVAKAGWGITGEGRLGAYQVVSFAGSFEPATSGSCVVGKGNVAIFEGDQLRAIAYGRSGTPQMIGHIEKFGKDGLRIWDGDIVPAPVADMRVTDNGLVIGQLAAQERTCGGAVPKINGMPITRARVALIGAGWKPVNHGGPADRIDDRERELVEKGVVEVDSCSGTGFGYCAYDYTRTDARLAVTTVGDGEDPTVSDYSVSCGQ